MTALSLATSSSRNPALFDDGPLPELVSKINEAHSAAQDALRNSVQCAIQCGEWLIQAHEDVPHGRWELWVKAKTAMSATTARGYMRLARLDKTNRQRVADLSLRQALADIAKESARQTRLEREAARQARRESAAAAATTAASATPAPSLPVLDLEYEDVPHRPATPTAPKSVGVIADDEPKASLDDYKAVLAVVPDDIYTPIGVLESEAMKFVFAMMAHCAPDDRARITTYIKTTVERLFAEFSKPNATAEGVSDA